MENKKILDQKEKELSRSLMKIITENIGMKLNIDNETRLKKIDKMIQDAQEKVLQFIRESEHIKKQKEKEDFEFREIDNEDWDKIKKECNHFLMGNGYKEGQNYTINNQDQQIEIDAYEVVPCIYDALEESIWESGLKQKNGFAIFGSAPVYNYPSEPDDVDVYLIGFTEDHLTALSIVLQNINEVKHNNLIETIDTMSINEESDIQEELDMQNDLGMR